MVTNKGEHKTTPVAAKVVALLLAASFLALPVIVYLKWPRPAQTPATSVVPPQQSEPGDGE